MTPADVARALRDELEEVLAEPGIGASQQLTVEDVRPPMDLDPGDVFRVIFSAPGGRSLEVSLPVGLAVGYLADEEAAVDEFKSWVRGLAECGE